MTGLSHSFICDIEHGRSEPSLETLRKLAIALNVNPEIYPELEEFTKIKEESEKLKRIKEAEKRRQGTCEECGHEGILFKVNGTLVCESCRDSF